MCFKKNPPSLFSKWTSTDAATSATMTKRNNIHVSMSLPAPKRSLKLPPEVAEDDEKEEGRSAGDGLGVDSGDGSGDAVGDMIKVHLTYANAWLYCIKRPS